MIHVAIEILVDSPDLAIKKLSTTVRQGVLAILHGENNVKQQLGVRIRHGEHRGKVLVLGQIESAATN